MKKKDREKIESLRKKASEDVRLAIKETNAALDKELKIAKQKLVKIEKRIHGEIKKDPERALKIAAGLSVAVGTIIGATAASILKYRKKKNEGKN